MAIDEVLAALESVENTGSFCTNKSISSANFDIKFNKIGTIEFPIQDQQIHALISIAKPAKFGWKDQTILDKDVRDVWEIPKNKIRIGKKQWDAKIKPMLDVFKDALGLPKKSKLTAELHNMLIYEAGHFFKPHQDTEKVDGMVATLVIVLPTAHTGGELVIDHQGVKKTFKCLPDISKLSCIAFYADCYHEVKEVLSGYRVSLTYNLVLEKYKGNMESLFDFNFDSKLEKALLNHFFSKNMNETPHERENKPPKLVFLLDHQYTQHSLSWDGLKNLDQVRVNAIIKFADKLGLTALLALADMQETWDCEFDYEEYRYRKKYRDNIDVEEEGIPTYLMDTNTVLKHWVDRQGQPVNLKEFTPGNNEVCYTGANDILEPFQSEYEGWMGNYGNTLDRWYHRAAIVLWRKDDYYPVLFEIDQNSFVEEIFSLAKSNDSLSKLREMLQHAASYWNRYAQGHKAPVDIINVMELALRLNDERTSLNLLKVYDLTIVNINNFELWIKLIINYGDQWFISLLREITNKGKNTVNYTAIIGFSNLIQTAMHQHLHQDIIDWLIQYQFAAVQAEHKNQRYRDYSNRMNTMTDFILGTIHALDNATHLQAIHYLMMNEMLYPVLPLVALFETCVNKLQQSDFIACGYPVLLSYIRDALSNEYRLGLRDKNDWSIAVKSKCSCANCVLLNQFLNQNDTQQKIWPLTQDARYHISQELKKLDIPVYDREEKTGRPFKIILQKTDRLYTLAENRYQAIEASLAKLNTWAK